MTTPAEDDTPVEREYKVVLESYTTYQVTAESPEAAAKLLLEFDGAQGYGENVDVRVDRVVAAEGNWTDEDLRHDQPCAGGCGKTLPPGPDDQRCLDCFMAYLEAKRKLRD